MYVSQDLSQIMLLLVDQLRFFPNESFIYLYNDSSIKTRSYILNGCIQYMKLWNSRKKSLKDILMFLKFNPRAFYFQESIT